MRFTDDDRWKDVPRRWLYMMIAYFSLAKAKAPGVDGAISGVLSSLDRAWRQECCEGHVAGELMYLALTYLVPRKRNFEVC